MGKIDQFYWDAISSLEVHDGGDDIQFSIKAYPYSDEDDPPWDDDAFAAALRPMWSVLEQVLEVLGGQQVSVISRSRVKDLDGLKEASRIATKAQRIAPRVWSGFHCSVELAEERDMQDGVLDLEVFLYSEQKSKEVNSRVSGEKKLALAAMMPELAKPVAVLFETVCSARAPIIRLYGPEWRDEPGHWYGTDHGAVQAVWHDDEERSPPDVPRNLIPFPRKV